MSKASRQRTVQLKGKTTLVTGAGGFLAYHLVQALADSGAHIIRLSRRPKLPPPPSKIASLRDVQGDPRHLSTWQSILCQVDVVFHLAAQTSAQAAEKNVAGDFRANVLPLLCMVRVCQREGRSPTVIFAGSITQVGLPKIAAVNESTPDEPVTFYDFHKLMAEKYLELFTHRGVVKGVTLRLPNVYGPGPTSKPSDRGVLNRMMRRALAGKTLILYGSGKQKRDYLYASDAAKAFMSAAAHIASFQGKHFVVGTGKGTTVLEAARLVARKAMERTGKQVRIVQVEGESLLSSIDRRCYVVDASRFRRLTGWRPMVTLSQGISKTMEEIARSASLGERHARE